MQNKHYHIYSNNPPTHQKKKTIILGIVKKNKNIVLWVFIITENTKHTNIKKLYI